MSLSVQTLDGFLNINKPLGVTSMDVVRRVKRLTKQRRVGHAGTLDPYATGVLPICFGQATRLMDYLINGRKVYDAVLRLGATTDTYDAAGNVTETKDYSLVRIEQFERSLDEFKGSIAQVPPMYSALKVGGKRLYDLARSGQEVDRAPRSVEVFAIEVVDWTPPYVKISVECGRGVYIRSLAHDIGQALGCGAHLSGLSRVRTGSFDISTSISLSELESKTTSSEWLELVFPMDFVVRNFKAAIVGLKIEDLIGHGRAIPQSLRIPPARLGDECRIYSIGGKFSAMLSFDAAIGQWRPVKVFSTDALKPEA